MKKDMTSQKPTNEGFAIAPKNYFIIAIGFVLIILGYFLMVGGASDDPNVFSEAIFSFRRIVLAPVVILLGFAVEIFALLWHPKEKDQEKLVSKK